MLGRALVLNATYEPLCVVSSRRALILILDEKAELVHATGHHFHSERSAFPEPSVVRLGQYIKVPRVNRVAQSRWHPYVGQRRRRVSTVQRSERRSSARRI